MTSCKRLFAAILLLAPASLHLPAQPQAYTISNGAVRLTVRTSGDSLLSDRLEILPPAGFPSGKRDAGVETDADFGLDVMITDWSAPGKANNADNPVLLKKADFRIVNHLEQRLADGTEELDLWFKANAASIDVRMSYRLEPGKFYARRKLAVSDTAYGYHFLQWLWGRHGAVNGVKSVVKAGDFGQPVALLTRDGGGAFFGLEYPASENRLDPGTGAVRTLRCGQEMGAVIGANPVEGEWVVTAVTPDERVKKRFFDYVDDIRVAALRPYTLYNSWYDLRSPEYPKVPAEHWMGEESALKMARLLRENMIEKHGIALDAFVLDDGWDVYESDWELRRKEWPRGLKPLADELRKSNTSLGIWIGPTGGYSFRTRRLDWMGGHGYETVGKTKNDRMLCVAGTNYGNLLRKRVADFVAQEGVGYFKWDGIQFSCSQPDHGHPVGIYSRRAVMESVIGMCATAREKDPAAYLNVTSGTWLSPWWVKYANTIWMQGSDYGYSDVPSISKRDAAITYRDFILYDDLTNLDLWFPVANLMTHGIIKGRLEMLGSAGEPLDKFTDDALLYFARGISMYELYVSPDILSDGEWKSISESIAWAKDRFGVLRNTTMVGGNPMKRETYGYVHYAGDRGVIAARNPFIEEGELAVTLDPADGIDPAAKELVVEQVYPRRSILPGKYRAGQKIDIPLDGYETAVFEVYPAAEAVPGVPAGVAFDLQAAPGGALMVNYLPKGSGSSGPVRRQSVEPAKGDRSNCVVKFELSKETKSATLAVLLTPDAAPEGMPMPVLSVDYDGASGLVRSEEQEGKSQWFTVELPSGVGEARISIAPGKDGKEWRGGAQVWLIADEEFPTATLTLGAGTPAPDRPMPPRVRAAGAVRSNVKLGTATLLTTSK
jgi:hypothetical protein